MSTHPTTYTLNDAYLLLQDAPKNFYNLDFHLKSGDYLGLVAGALGLVIDDYARKNDTDSVRKELLFRKIQGDLAKLHRTHTINPKKKD